MNTLVLYATKDYLVFEQLDKHLALLKRQNVLTIYHKNNINASSETAANMKTYLQQTDIVLLLVSADFLHSDEQFGYAQQALQQNKNRSAYNSTPLYVERCQLGTHNCHTH